MAGNVPEGFHFFSDSENDDNTEDKPKRTVPVKDPHSKKHSEVTFETSCGIQY